MEKPGKHHSDQVDIISEKTNKQTNKSRAAGLRCLNLRSGIDKHLYGTRWVPATHRSKCIARVCFLNPSNAPLRGGCHCYHFIDSNTQRLSNLPEPPDLCMSGAGSPAQEVTEPLRKWSSTCLCQLQDRACSPVYWVDTSLDTV